MLGLTGASGAPYAARVLEALVEAGAAIGVVASRDGRRLVVVPRETPVSEIHLENLLRLKRAGAAVVPAMPGFYHLPESIADMVDFVASRILAAAGVDLALIPSWGSR